MKKRNLSKSDLQRLAAWERSVIQSGEPVRISELKDFEFKDFTEMRFAYDDGKLGFSIPYRGELLQHIAPTGEIWSHRIFTWMPILMSLFCVYLARTHSNWMVLFGILTAILGLMVSTPYNPFRRIILWLSIISVITAYYFSWFSLTIISVSFLVSNFSGIAAREMYSKSVTEAVLYSEVVFCYLYSRKLILIQYIKDTRK